MANRDKWQYCQIEVGANRLGILKQFFSDRAPVETDLHQAWPAMLAKLGEQGWELVSAFPNEGGRGRSPLTYVFKRTYPGSSAPVVNANVAQSMPASTSPPQPPSSTSAPISPDEPPEDKGPVTDFEPLDF